jgi:hypothetical protein
VFNASHLKKALQELVDVGFLSDFTVHPQTDLVSVERRRGVLAIAQ